MDPTMAEPSPMPARNPAEATSSGTGALSGSRTTALPALDRSGMTNLSGITTPDNPDAVLEEVAKGGSNVDTALGRLVVDYGLATREEVDLCLDRLKQASAGPGDEAGQRSLALELVDQEFVTKRQIARLKAILDAERSGQKIPGYRLLGKLGAGAMATVYKARQLNLDRLVAIKVLPRKFSQNPQFIERFYAEGRAAAQLNHPHIVQAYDVGKSGEYHYFVMEFVDGRTVYDDIVKHKRYGEKEAIDIIRQVALALGHAHERGIIHRDVKPKNIMITNEGVVKLADMGLARAMSDKEAAEAEAGKAFGTPFYISPEQIRGETNVGPEADIYSLGATLYHMVTGSVPFDGKNPTSVMHKHLKADPVPPDQANPRLSGAISEVIEMMLAKKREQRYRTIKDLLGDLDATKAGKPPPLAHRGLGQADLASLSHLETASVAAPPEMQPIQPASGNDMRTPLLVALGLALLASVVLNLVQLL
ncbi:MAG: serine/threonine protein kinase [Phycisphaeraceae bacterium]|nr:serine/threonine protein kinase [Phycisphaeraceae bacterium]